MGSIVSCFNRVCTEKYKTLGFVTDKSFKLTRNTPCFARIVGDVVQSFTLKPLSGGRECTVTFGIDPLCMEVPYYLGGIYELNQFFVETSPWPYDPKSDSSKSSCIASLTEAIDTHLLTLFDACMNCQSAFVELQKTEERFDKIRQKWLESMHLQDCSKPWWERALFDNRKYYMALKIQDWDYAHRYCTAWINTLDQEFEQYRLLPPSKVPEYVMQRMKMREGFAKNLHRLNSGDYTYFVERVKNNEEQFLSYIAKNYPKLLGDCG